MKYCVDINDLTHRFQGHETVLQSINLQVPNGSIYGFLGPNGAGKTTTLRLLLGLLRIQRGTVSIFGLPLKRNRLEILRKIGSFIEAPSLYEHLTAAENLNIWRTIYQCSKPRIHEVLEMVG